MLFDPDNLASRLCPRPQALRHLIDLLSAEQLQDAWQPGNEETIGWVYQAFNAEELEQVFREVRVAKKKFEASDIPSVTQLFTPRWIVSKRSGWLPPSERLQPWTHRRAVCSR